MVRLRLTLPSYDKESLIRLRVDKSFKARSKITKRTLEVAKAFGIGVDEERVFQVYREFELEVNPGEIIYITGESGSGKSILLREIGRGLRRRREFGGVLMGHELEIDPDEILIHGVGRDTREAIELLSMVGLNEAYLFLRRYRELSEGQRYRYRLAKAFWSGRKTLILDEFCSTLDRITARVVAYLCQKFSRRRKLTLIAASAHEDLIEDLNPDKVIVKRFGPYAELRILDPKPRPCSILNHVEIEDGTYQDYKVLAAFHYIGGRVGYIRRIFRAIVELDGRRELAGVVVYTHPYSELSARNRALPILRELRRRLGRRGFVKLIDQSFSRVARIIVHPKFRGIGLAVKLLKETMPLLETPYVEALAVMAKYNPFFEHAGMRRVEYRSRTHEEIKRLLVKLQEYGVQPNRIHSKRYLRRILSQLSKKELKTISAEVRRIKMIEGKIGFEEIIRFLSGLRAQPEYFIWRDPRKPSITDMAKTLKSVARGRKI